MPDNKPYDEANEFEFQGAGDIGIVRTGMKQPEAFNLALAPFPQNLMWEMKDICTVINDPNRIPRRRLFDLTNGWLISQGRRSSCNAYAMAGAKMRLDWFADMSPVTSASVVRYYAPEYNYMRINGGRDQGSMLDDGAESGEKHGFYPKDGGMIPYESYQWDRIGFDKKMQVEGSAKEHRFLEAYRLPITSHAEYMQAMASAICNDFQIVMALHVGNAYMQNGGVDRGPGNHAVGVDDVLTGGRMLTNPLDLCFDQYGSWNLHHGDKGRVKVVAGHSEQCYKIHVTYAIRGIPDKIAA